MRSTSVLVSVASYGMTAFVLSASVVLTSEDAAAEDASLNHGRVSCQPICKNSKATLAKAHRDDSDAAAALESVQYALSHVGDGGTYVWNRRGARLSGVVQPTKSFRNTAGAICRHVVMLVAKGARSAKAEGIACRLADGRWNLEG